MKCKTCYRELSRSDILNRSKECGSCKIKRKEVRKLIEAFDEFKKRIDYDEVLRHRERRNEILNKKV